MKHMQSNPNRPDTVARGPLYGLKVVELSTYIAAPTCARLLADMGADVIKVESAHGDPWRSVSMMLTSTTEEENPVFDVYNVGKKSIRLDIRSGEGRDILIGLLAHADVFITNTRMQSLRKYGLDPGALCARYSRLVYASISGYGESGPESESPGFDNVAYWTRSGFLLDMRIEASQAYPVNSPTGGGDVIAGGTLFGSVMAALYRRERTGQGDHVSVSLYNMGIWAMGSMILQAQEKYGAKFPKTRRECGPFASPYLCKDGEWLAITILEYEKYVPILLSVLKLEEEVRRNGLYTVAEMTTHSEIMVPLLEAAFARKPSAHWLKELKAKDIVCAVMNHFRDVPSSEQAWANGYVEDYSFRNGERCVMPCPPVRMASWQASPTRLAPLPGEDAEEILAELGLTNEEIEDLRRRKVAF
jgi:crotonobetainyl-CoA:carnitine CoA-transferase CaiB-like acyl-CoA transferase